MKVVLFVRKIGNKIKLEIIVVDDKLYLLLASSESRNGFILCFIPD